MNPAFEELLAFHCAPALAGIKAANLVSCPRQLVEDPEELVAQYGRTLGSRGIHLRILCRCPKGTLILVYREDRLARCLARPGGGSPPGPGWLPGGDGGGAAGPPEPADGSPPGNLPP